MNSELFFIANFHFLAIKIGWAWLVSPGIYYSCKFQVETLRKNGS